MITAKYIIDIISEINSEIMEQLDKFSEFLEFRSYELGDYRIYFMGNLIWDYDNDIREEIYPDVYEALDVYLRRILNEKIRSMSIMVV